MEEFRQEQELIQKMHGGPNDCSRPKAYFGLTHMIITGRLCAVSEEEARRQINEDRIIDDACKKASEAANLLIRCGDLWCQKGTCLPYVDDVRLEEVIFGPDVRRSDSGEEECPEGQTWWEYVVRADVVLRLACHCVEEP